LKRFKNNMVRKVIEPKREQEAKDMKINFDGKKE
jgi:hypothetical protein